MKKENNIDQLFKKGMEDPDIPFNELDWNKMAGKLDAAESKRRYPLWLYAAVGTAAMLLIALFVLLNPKTPAVDQQGSNLTTRTKPQLENKRTPLVPADSSDKNKTTAAIKVGKSRSGAPADGSATTNNSMPDAKAMVPMLVEVPTIKLPQFFSQQQLIAKRAGDAATTRNIVEPPRLSSGTPGKLSLSIIAAPDITDTKSSLSRKVSSNVGLLLNYPISKKLGLSTGAIYAKKVYDYGGTTAAGYGAEAAPWKLDADCFVLDIPLNVNYQVAQKRNYTVSVNTGLSSYIMLREKYRINTAPQTSNSIINVDINNQNRHFFGVANFSFTVDRKISDRVNVGIQPFVKVPLTGIGYYNYDLRSKGVAVSLSLKPF